MPRLRVVDTKDIEFRTQNRKKRRNKHTANKVNHIDNARACGPEDEQWPLEASPILRSVLEYGRRTASLCAQNSSRTLINFAKKIRNLGQMSSDLEQIVIEAEKEAFRLKLSSEQIYESDE